MTANQLMVLLDAYRGTLSRKRHLGTFDTDVIVLQKLAWLKSDKTITEWGVYRLRRILKNIR